LSGYHDRVPSLLAFTAAHHGRLVWIAVALALVSAVAVHVSMALHATIPVLWTDELGYLADAQVLSGIGEPRDLAGRGYYIGWSLLLVPFWWLTSDLELIYRCAVGLSAAIGIAVTVPLAAIARRLGLSWQWSLVIAAAISLAPARASMSTFALSENLLALVIALAVLAAMTYATTPTVRSAVVLALAASGLFIVHGRTISVAIAVGVWFIWNARRHLWSSISGLATLATVGGAGYALYRWTVSLLYAPSADREASAVERVFGSDPGALATSATGQVWYEYASWAGLALVGGVALAAIAVREIRAKSPSIASFSVIALIGALVVSATWVARTVGAGRDRLDIYSYGRYLETFGFLLALLGLVVIVRGLRRTQLIAVAIGAAAITVIFFVAVAPQAPLGGALFWGATSVPGLLQWPWPHVSSQLQPPWWLAGIFAVVATAGIVILRKRPAVIVAVFVLFFALSSVTAQVRTLDPYFSGFRESFGLRVPIAEYRDATVSFDTSGLNNGSARDTVSRNAYQYWGSPRPVVVFDSEATVPTTDLVIARQEWQMAKILGALKISDDTGLFDNALWVMPGALQDELVAEGVVSHE
jgi:hypothetical protein